MTRSMHKDSRARFWWVTFSLVAAALLAVLFAASNCNWRKFVADGGDPYKMMREREARLALIATALDQFRTAHGRWPSSDQDLFQHDSATRELIESSVSHAVNDRFVVRYDSLAAPKLAIVVDDPGFDWIGYSSGGSNSQPEMEEHRRVLTSGLEVLPRTWVIEQINRQAKNGGKSPE